MPQTYNENVELSSLACLLKNGSLFSIVEDLLEKKSYAYKPFGIIFQSIKDIISNDVYPDTVTVCTDLDRKGLLEFIHIPSNNKNGKEAIEFISSMDVKVDNLESYARQIQELYATRQLSALFDKGKAEIEEGKSPIEILSQLNFETGKISTYVGGQSKNIRTARDVGSQSLEEFEEASNGNSLYISTGISAWDDFVNGLFPGRLYIVAAASNDGKSSLVQNILHNVSIDNKIKSFLLTLEASSVEVYNKMNPTNDGHFKHENRERAIKRRRVREIY